MIKGLFILLAAFYCQLSIGQQIFSNSTDLLQRKNISGLPESKKELPSFSQALVYQKESIDHPLQPFYFKKQDTDAAVVSPYTTSLLADGLTITGAVGVTFLGYELISNKKDLTPAELAAKTKDKLPFFDRFVAGNFSPQADRDSYILFDADYALPFIVALINKNERAKFGQVAILYVETIAITGSMYTLAAGLVYRSRPFVYGDKAPMAKRLDKGAQRSFYGGHVAGTAASLFFISKVFQDFNPGSKITPYLYVASGALTGLMAYMRMKAGYHFLSDCLLSSAIGAATGIVIPQFHKNKNLKNVSITPEVFSNGASGLAMTYRF